MKPKQKILLISILFLSFFIEKNEKNAQNEANKAELGHYLFFDKHLSRNNTKSCASCHAPELAFTDGYRRSLGAEGDLQQHNAPTLLNIADYKTFHWADTTITSIEMQLRQPLFATHALELGLNEQDTSFFNYFKQNKTYQTLFAKAFSNDFSSKNAYNYKNIIAALASYVKSLNSRNSLYDKYKNGDSAALNHVEKLGEKLFFKQLNCGICHPYPSFTLATQTADAYANIGLYQKYPVSDNGLFSITKKQRDKGKFRIPTLRNVALTAPYMHDGSVRELAEVVDIFAQSGKAISYGKHAGNGFKNKQKSALIQPFSITKQEKQALIAFLYTLTDTSYLKNAHFLVPTN